MEKSKKWRSTCLNPDNLSTEFLHHWAKFMDHLHVLSEGINSGTDGPRLPSDEASSKSMEKKDLEQRYSCVHLSCEELD